MSTIELCYATCCLATKTVAPNLPVFQDIKRCAQYLASHPHEPIFIHLMLMIDQTSSGLHGVGIKLNTTQPITVWNVIKMLIMPEFST